MKVSAGERRASRSMRPQQKINGNLKLGSLYIYRKAAAFIFKEWAVSIT